MKNWKRLEQETDGNYFFSGLFYCTQRVHQELTAFEIVSVYTDIQNLILEKGGVDYLQIYKDERGRTLYFIDNLSLEQVLSGNYKIEDNYCTLLFSEEY